MKKNKLILLTVLIILVLYCGAVIFVTKPDSFAYEALFNGAMGAVTVPTSEQAAAKAQAEHDALMAEIQAMVQSVSEEEARKAADQAVETSVKKADEDFALAISEAVIRISDSVPELVREEVGKAVAALDLQAAVEASASGIVDQAVAKVESNLKAYAPAITQAIVPELLRYEDALAADIYSRYYDILVEEVTKAVIEKLEAAIEEPETEARQMTAEEYEAIRRQVREDAIKRVLDSLKD